jgi:tripartite-type tricarboxylate transporter receptor subunit TctC
MHLLLTACSARAALLLACFGCAGLSAHAAWPNDEPIKIVVPQAVGGTNDTVARLVGVELGKRLRQSVIIENRPGAAGGIGMQAVAKSKPDGYTLAMASDSASLLDVTRPGSSWKFKRDITGIAMIGDQPITMSVPANSPYKSVADLVAAARLKPDSIGFGTSGTGTSQHVVGEWFARLAGIRLVHVPYKGGGQAINDLLGSQVPFAVLGLAPVIQQFKSGGVRIIAITAAKRDPSIPSVPTLSELGYPQIALTQWAGLVAPNGIAPAILKRLSDEMLAVLAVPEVKRLLVSAGVDPRPMNSTEFDAFLKTNSATWEQVVPSLNLKLD